MCDSEVTPDSRASETSCLAPTAVQPGGTATVRRPESPAGESPHPSSESSQALALSMPESARKESRGGGGNGSGVEDEDDAAESPRERHGDEALGIVTVHLNWNPLPSY